MAQLGEGQIGGTQLGEDAAAATGPPEPDFHVTTPKQEISSITDTLTALSDKVIKRLSETVSSIESLEIDKSLIKSFSETFAVKETLVTDANLVATSIKRVLSETSSVKGAVHTSKSSSQVITEALSVVEDIVNTKNKTFFVEKIREHIAVSEKNPRFGSVFRTFNESFSVKESLSPIFFKKLIQTISVDDDLQTFANIVQKGIQTARSVTVASHDDVPRIVTAGRTFSETSSIEDFVDATRTLVLGEVVAVIAEHHNLLDFVRRSKIGKTFANIKDSGFLDS